MTTRFLTALPVYNEARHLDQVLDAVALVSPEVLVIDDGSTDHTARLLTERMRRQSQLSVVRHSRNRGYGAALRSAFEVAIREEYEVLVTIDCDGQHEPQLIPTFVAAARQAEIVSGSRYLRPPTNGSEAPAQRRQLNREITALVNRSLGLLLTDAFCGFKAYRVDALRKLNLTEDGYAMPLECWVQAVSQDLSIRELPVPLIYLDERRSFGGSLDDAQRRRAYYLEVLQRSMSSHGKRLPRPALRRCTPSEAAPSAACCPILLGAEV